MLQLSTCWFNPALLLPPHGSPFLCNGFFFFLPLLIFGSLCGPGSAALSHLGMGSVHLVHLNTRFFKVCSFGLETPVHWSIIRVERSLELLFSSGSPLNFGPAHTRKCAGCFHAMIEPCTATWHARWKVFQLGTINLTQPSVWRGEAKFRRCWDELSITLDGPFRFMKTQGS